MHTEWATILVFSTKFELSAWHLPLGFSYSASVGQYLTWHPYVNALVAALLATYPELVVITCCYRADILKERRQKALERKKPSVGSRSA